MINAEELIKYFSDGDNEETEKENKKGKKDKEVRKMYKRARLSNLGLTAGSIGILSKVLDLGDSDIQGSDEIKNKLLKEIQNKRIKNISTPSFREVYGLDLGNKKLNRMVDYVLTGGSAYSPLDASPAIVAHELGHRHFLKDNDTNKLGKIMHKLRFGGFDFEKEKKSGNLADLIKAGKKAEKLSNLPQQVAKISAIISGARKAKKERDDKKESKLNKYTPYVLSALGSIPTLASEAAASIHGYNKLKGLGASPELLKNSKKQLIGAGATYLLSGLGGNLAKTGTSRALGYAVGKHFLYKKKKNKEEEED